MAMFDFLKKKERELPLPPPPLPPSASRGIRGDFEPIRAMPSPPMRDWQAPMPQMEDHEEQHDDVQMPFPPLPPMPSMGDMDMHDDEHHDDVPLLPAPRMPAMEEEVVYDRTVMPNEEAAPRDMPKRSEERSVPAKTFVSVNDYKQILSETNMVRQRLLNADNFVKKLQDLRVDEERALERWRSQLEDVEKKLAYVDQLIEKSQR